MKTFPQSRDAASRGAALMIVLAFVVLLAGVALAYFSRTTTDRQLAHSSYNDTSADLLTRSALDIIVGNFKQEILTAGAVTSSNIQPQRSGDDAAIPNLIRRSISNDSIPVPGVSSLASVVSSKPVDPTNPKRGEVTSARWNSHYLIPPGVDLTATDLAPYWVLLTRNGPVAFSAWQNSLKDPTSTNYVVGRYAFAVYDEGGLLDMNLGGYPNWPYTSSGCSDPNAIPTPWPVNIGRKGIQTFADLTALPAGGTSFMTQPQIDKIVGWRNYAMTQRNGASFDNPNFVANCDKQNFYGSYLLYFGDPPFSIESATDKLASSTYPFTSVSTYINGGRTDQAFMTRQQLLKLQRDIGFSPNVLQYMGTFSRERNWPAPDWPNLNGTLSEGRFNMNNLALVIPNPGECNLPKGKKKGWLTGRNRNHLCGTPNEIIELFGLFWVKADAINTNLKIPGHWRYVDHTGPNPPGDPDPNPHSIICFRGANEQEDFFQVLHYALNVGRTEGGRRCPGPDRLPRTFAIGASLIDQYDSGEDCETNPRGPGCDLDSRVNSKYQTHTTVIQYGQGASGGGSSFAFGVEPNRSTDARNGDELLGTGGNNPHRPCGGQGGDCAPGEPPAPVPALNTQVISHAFSNVGEFGYGIDTSTAGLPTMDFGPPNFYDAPVLDFFSYNPVSSAYPRAGIVNLYTRNAPVLAAIIAGTRLTESPEAYIPPSQAMTAANAIVAETQGVLAGVPPSGWPVTQTTLTRAIAARLTEKGGAAISGTWTNEQKQSIARALAEVGQTRTWNLLIDVIAQTGHYGPNAQGLTDFIAEGEKRYWLHIALGRDLIQSDGLPCGTTLGAPCQVDVLGTQLEEVIE